MVQKFSWFYVIKNDSSFSDLFMLTSIEEMAREETQLSCEINTVSTLYPAKYSLPCSNLCTRDKSIPICNMYFLPYNSTRSSVHLLCSGHRLSGSRVFLSNVTLLGLLLFDLRERIPSQ